MKRCSNLQRRILQCVADLEAEYGEPPTREQVKCHFFGLRKSCVNGQGHRSGQAEAVYKPSYSLRENMLAMPVGERLVYARTHLQASSFNRSVQNLIDKGWLAEEERVILRQFVPGGYRGWVWSVTRTGRSYCC